MEVNNMIEENYFEVKSTLLLFAHEIFSFKLFSSFHIYLISKMEWIEYTKEN